MSEYLNPIKGWHKGIANLDFVAPKAEASPRIPSGSVCSLTAAGEMQLGLAPNAMPLFAFNASDSYDVAAPDSTNNLNDVFGADVLTLVATGGYELQSTQIKTGAAAGMLPNTFLTSDNPDGAQPGKLAVATLHIDGVCGQVSRIPAVNYLGDTVVSFWSMQLPAVLGGS